MNKKAVSLSETQADLLLQMMKVPQLTVTFTKATEAGELYDAINQIVEQFNNEKEIETAKNT